MARSKPNKNAKPRHRATENTGARHARASTDRLLLSYVEGLLTKRSAASVDRYAKMAAAQGLSARRVTAFKEMLRVCRLLFLAGRRRRAEVKRYFTPERVEKGKARLIENLRRARV